MKNYRIIFIIGVTEILIGSSALFVNLLTVFLTVNVKTPNVLFFVVMTGIMSTFLGIGILKFNRTAYELLIYFSSVIVLSKILIIFGVIHLNGSLEVSLHKAWGTPLTTELIAFSTGLKNALSIMYHGFIISYFRKNDLKQLFES
jgi:hypothetical protein